MSIVPGRLTSHCILYVKVSSAKLTSELTKSSPMASSSTLYECYGGVCHKCEQGSRLSRIVIGTKRRNQLSGVRTQVLDQSSDGLRWQRLVCAQPDERVSSNNSNVGDRVDLRRRRWRRCSKDHRSSDVYDVHWDVNQSFVRVCLWHYRGLFRWSDIYFHP